MKIRGIFGVLCAGAVLFGACSSDDDKEDPLDRASGFCADWAERACSEAVQRRCSSGSQERCEGAQLDFCLDLVPDELYSKAGAKDCLDAVKDAYEDGELTGAERDTVVHLAGECAAVLSGDGDEDDDCTDDLDCDTSAGLRCVRRLDEPSGTCQEPVEVAGGRECDDPDEVCESGFYCDEERNCLAKKRLGRECSETIPCEDDLRCVVPADAGVGVCTAKTAVADECESDDECVSGICRQGASSLICAEVIVLDVGLDICEDFR